MKKLILILSILTIALFSKAFALNNYITGTALEDFSTAEPKNTFTVKLDSDYVPKSGDIIKEGTILHGVVVEVSNGKIGKRQGYFVFEPTHIAFNESIEEKKLNLKVKVSFYKPFDKANAAKRLANSGITTVASHVFQIPFLSQGISFIKGAANHDIEDNALEGGLKQVYEDSPLSYVQKGSSLIIQQGQEVKLIIKEND